MKVGNESQRLEVQAFLILERVAGSKEFLLSVLLQAGGQFIGKSFLGMIAEGQQISLSLGWDQPRRRFVAASQTAGSAPILSFIPFASPRADDGLLPSDISVGKCFALNWDMNNDAEAHGNQN